MAVCYTCGAEASTEDRYCAQCGSGLRVGVRDGRPAAYCTGCGTEATPGARFCGNCGFSLDSATASAPATTLPAAVAGVEYMGFWVRLVAQTADYVILSVVGLILAAVSSAIPFFGILAIPVLFYWFYKEVKGRSLGRRLAGIEVISESGEPISFWRGLLRETVGKWVSIIFLGLGFIWVAFDSRKQGWHDKIAGTYVVKRRPAFRAHTGPSARQRTSAGWERDERASF